MGQIIQQIGTTIFQWGCSSFTMPGPAKVAIASLSTMPQIPRHIFDSNLIYISNNENGKQLPGDKALMEVVTLIHEGICSFIT
jgi:hypothetical protein